MALITTDTPKSPHSDPASFVPVLPATSFNLRSRRGMDHPMVILRACPNCGRSHWFRAAGYRVLPCKGGGGVILKARRARTTPPRIREPVITSTSQSMPTMADSGASNTNRGGL